MNPTDNVLKILLKFADRDNNIRAVMMGGSRAFGKTDKYSDYDIIYVTRSNEPYWGGKVVPFLVECFGEIAVMQTPDNGDPHDVYTHLIQFCSGTRVDLTFHSLAFLSRPDTSLESTTTVLFDKDNAFTCLPAPCDEDYCLKPPNTEEFSRRTNQFWWVSPYVAKAVCRGQALHAVELLGHYIRSEYSTMLAWLTGVRNNWNHINTGKHYTDIKNLLSPEDWCYYEILLDSYVPANGDKIRASLELMMSAFHKIAPIVSSGLGYSYDFDEGRRTMAFIQRTYPPVLTE